MLFTGLDLRVGPGQLVWLRGDNGRGKTSLLRILAGVVAPEEGEVLWYGQPARSAAGVPWQPAYVAHANALKEDLSVREALSFLADISMHAPSLPTLQAVQAALARVSMQSSSDALVRTLSQGQRRRVALARLVLQASARIWLLDEPYDALDQTSTRSLNELLGEHLRAGGCVVLTSHQPLTDDAPRAEPFWLRGPVQAGGWTDGRV